VVWPVTSAGTKRPQRIVDMANSAKVGSPSFDKYVQTMGNNVGEIAAVEGKTKMQGGLDEENTRDAALIASRAISLKIAKDSERTAEGINRAFCGFYDAQRDTARLDRYAHYDAELRLHGLGHPALIGEFTSGNLGVLRVEHTYRLNSVTKKAASECRKEAQSAWDSDESGVIHIMEEGEDTNLHTLTTFTRNTPEPTATRKEYGASGRNRVNTYRDLYSMCVYFCDPEGGNDIDFLLEQLNPALTSQKSSKILPVSDRMQVLRDRMRENEIKNNTMPISTVRDEKGHRHVRDAYEHYTDAQLEALGLSAEVEQVPLNEVHADFLQEKKEVSSRVKLVTRCVTYLDANCGLKEVHEVEANRYSN